jgi:hypothetical protein
MESQHWRRCVRCSSVKPNDSVAEDSREHIDATSLICLVCVLSPLEVLVLSDIWHGGQDFCKALLGCQ